MHWHLPVLGAIEAECCCVRPGTLIERNPWTNFWHDRRCHGWRTAFYNLWISTPGALLVRGVRI
jgi:hypothetical protein